MTVSSLAAYNANNLVLQNNAENTLENGKPISSGEMLYDGSANGRPNEADIYQKYKGIARNQSNQIDANLEFTIDDNSSGQLQLQMNDPFYTNTGGVYGPRDEWNTQLNPLNDAYAGLLYAMPKNLHEFTYHYDDNKQWYFDFEHEDTRKLNLDDHSMGSKNQEVPNDIKEEAKNDVREGQKTFTVPSEYRELLLDGGLSPDKYALQMGSWGVVYHYTITVYNTSEKTKYVQFQTVPKAKYMLVGIRKNSTENYNFNDNQELTGVTWAPFDSEEIPPGYHTFEIVTLSGLGNGGLENMIMVSNEKLVKN